MTMLVNIQRVVGQVLLKGYELNLYEVTSHGVMGQVVTVDALSNMLVALDRPTEYVDYSNQVDGVKSAGVIRTGRMFSEFIPDSIVKYNTTTTQHEFQTRSYFSGLYEVTLVAVGSTGRKSKESDSILLRLVDLAPSPPRIRSLVN